MKKLFALLGIIGMAGMLSAQTPTMVKPNQGGTGINSSNATGCPILSHGIWTIGVCPTGSGSGNIAPSPTSGPITYYPTPGYTVNPNPVATIDANGNVTSNGVVQSVNSQNTSISTMAPQFCGTTNLSNAQATVTCLQSALDYGHTHNIAVLIDGAGQTYNIDYTQGTFPLKGDNGVCPTGATVNGAACTDLAADTTYNLAYNLHVWGNQKISCAKGVRLTGHANASPTGLTNPALFLLQDTLTVNATIPYYSGSAGVEISGCEVSVGFLGLWAPGTLSFANIHDNNFNFLGMAGLFGTSDRSKFENNVTTNFSDWTFGGMSTTRGNDGSAPSGNSANEVEQAGYVDSPTWRGGVWQQLGDFPTFHAALDDWFAFYILRDQNFTNGRRVDVVGTTSPLGARSLFTTLPNNGVFGRKWNVYNRGGRANNGGTLGFGLTEFTAREVIYYQGFVGGLEIGNIGPEAAGSCGNGYGTGDPAHCPDPLGTGFGVGDGYMMAFMSFRGGVSLSSISEVGGAAYANSTGNKVFWTPSTIPNFLGLNSSNNDPNARGLTSSIRPPNAVIIDGQGFTTSTVQSPGPCAWWLGSTWHPDPTGTRQDYWSVCQNTEIGEGNGSNLTFGNFGQGGLLKVVMPSMQLQDPGAALGTCNAANAGTMEYINSTPSFLRVCIRDSGGVYAFKNITTVP